MSADSRVRDHFHGDANRFDAIYDDRKGLVGRFVDNFWRGVVRRRLDLAVQLLQPLAGKHVLDVGCGSGRFCVAFAREGATRVLGVDFAPAMIQLAEESAHRAGVADHCEFRLGAFPDVVGDESFDVTTAIGFFDYIAEPGHFIAQMDRRTRTTMVMSFPKAREWRVPIRRLRFWLRGCPLFLYSEAQVRGLLADAGILHYDWIALDRDYLVVTRKS
jgi:2-polyprenyl-3-methyl-5-hydroxy-6-metoxy-1,4-benzoquinol methylase